MDTDEPTIDAWDPEGESEPNWLAEQSNLITLEDGFES